MRARLALAMTSAAALAVGCFDLFHSTDFDNACIFDAALEGCPIAAGDEAHPGDSPNGDGPDQGDAGGDDSLADGADVVVGPTDFCSWEGGTSHEAARRACAWLGACSGPFGNNEFGTCLDYALRAYDCSISPSFPLALTSDAHRYWDCLQKAGSCTEVTNCVFPDPKGQQTCTSSEIACGAAPLNASTRMDCLGAGATPAAAEACIAVGQTCDPNGSFVQCNAKSDGQCKPLSCEGNTLRDCNDAGKQERGVDCTNYGAGSCTSVALVTDAGADAAMSTCAPKPGTACTRSPNVSCNLGVASACFTGTLETLDCRVLLEDAGTCDTTAGAGQPIWDLSRYCVSNGGGCTESCGDGGVFTACHRGKPVTVDCAKYVHTNCARDPIGTGHPACVKP